MSDCMTFPDTVEEFMEQYKVVDTDGIYMSKGAELVPTFRMRQWFEHLPSAQPEIDERMSETEQNVPNDDFISRKGAIDALMEDFKRIPTNAIRAKTVIEQLPSAQPETARRIVGKSRDGMTLWYQCDMCNEPVDKQDVYCRGCGRRFVDE